MPYFCYTEEHKTYLEVTAARIQGAIFEPVADLTAQVWVTPEPVGFDHRKTGRRVLPVGLDQRQRRLGQHQQPTGGH